MVLVSLRLSLPCWWEQTLFLITKISFPVDNHMLSSLSKTRNDFDPLHPTQKTKEDSLLILHQCLPQNVLGTVRKVPKALLYTEKQPTLRFLHPPLFRNSITTSNVFPGSLQSISGKGHPRHLFRFRETVFKSVANLQTIQYSPHSHTLHTRRAVKRWVNQKHQ